MNEYITNINICKKIDSIAWLVIYNIINVLMNKIILVYRLLYIWVKYRGKIFI